MRKRAISAATKQDKELTLTSEFQIDILLATCNGERFLPDLLASLDGQSHTNWRLLVSDDGSADQTSSLIEIFAASHQVETFDGPQLGAGPNFLSLVKRSYADGALYAAFCDQDDIWFPDKLERAILKLAPHGQDKPAVYFSTQELIDEQGNLLGLNGSIQHPPSFKNALVQNIAAGCTILMNRPAMRLLSQLSLEDVSLHDWATYLVVAGAGDITIHDPEPTLYYRQHESNEIGANRGLRAILRRLSGILNGTYKGRNEQNLRALESISKELTPENQTLIQEIRKARNAGLVTRIRMFRGFGLYRQSQLQQMTLWFAIAIGKF